MPGGETNEIIEYKQYEPAIKNNMSKYIMISSPGKSVRVNIDNIIRVEVCKEHTVIFTECGSQHVYPYYLKVLEKELDSSIFFRSHRSHVININHIDYVLWHERVVVMIDRSKAPISIQNRAGLRRILKN